jgi:hypothetical protein
MVAGVVDAAGAGAGVTAAGFGAGAGAATGAGAEDPPVNQLATTEEIIIGAIILQSPAQIIQQHPP